MSVLIGVGSSPIFAASAIVGRSFAPGDGDLLILPLPLSIDVGVDSKSSGMNSVFPSELHRFSPCVCTVGNNPHAVPAVGRSDGTSRNNKRLDGITFSLKVAADGFDDVLLAEEYSFSVIFSEERGTASHFNLRAGLNHREDSSNVLANDPSRPDFTHSADNLRPEVAVIIRSFSLSGD